MKKIVAGLLLMTFLLSGCSQDNKKFFGDGRRKEKQRCTVSVSQYLDSVRCKRIGTNRTRRF